MKVERKKKLKRIDWDIAERIILVLYDKGEQRRTPLATKCNLNYANCLLYIQWMMYLDLVRWKTVGMMRIWSASLRMG
ncbi:hypothetical protein [Candidatus Nitrosotenuis uzonensis]|nr:hypothetical protein [Candidatus Nitrosotenuis uzonensis]